MAEHADANLLAVFRTEIAHNTEAMRAATEKMKKLKAENQRLRDALERIARMKNLGMVTDAVQEMQRLARAALAEEADRG